jgi:UDP-N-acetylglucosamine 2-epimerase
MVGNSSSGLIEAPIASLPAVNVGDRQRGRLRGDNVIDAPADERAIAAALGRALDPSLRARLDGKSPYGDGRSAPRIVALLRAWTPPRPPRKRFVDA